MHRVGETLMHRLQNRAPRINATKTGCSQKYSLHHHESTAVWTGTMLGAKLARRGVLATSADGKNQEPVWCVCARTRKKQRQESHVC